MTNENKMTSSTSGLLALLLSRPDMDKSGISGSWGTFAKLRNILGFPRVLQGRIWSNRIQLFVIWDCEVFSYHVKRMWSLFCFRTDFQTNIIEFQTLRKFLSWNIILWGWYTRNGRSNFPLFFHTLEEHLKMQIQDPRIIDRFFQVWSTPVFIAGKLYIRSLCKCAIVHLHTSSVSYIPTHLSLFCNVKLYVKEPTLYLNISKSTYYIYFNFWRMIIYKLLWQALILLENTKSEFCTPSILLLLLNLLISPNMAFQ